MQLPLLSSPFTYFSFSMSGKRVFPLIVLLCLLSSDLVFVQGCLLHELRALLRLRSTLNDTQGTLESWKGDDCCRWDGVICYGLEERRHVSELDVGGMGLTGNYFLTEIPSELGYLYYLRRLNLSPLQSSVNSYSANVSWLTSSNLQWLSNLSSLEYLSLSHVDVRDKSWGSIIGSLLRLRHLDLSWCSLRSPTIPNTLYNLSSLAFLRLRGNSFSNIPTWMGKLSNLTHLDLSRNNISGSVHNTIGNLPSLEYLDLSVNALTGQIPLSLGHNSRQYGSLYHLNLGRNNLDGTIPSSLGLLNNLTFLFLAENQLRGNIPASLGNLHKLDYLSLNNNQLNGSLPLSFAHLYSLRALYLYENNMNGTITEVFFQKSFKLRRLSLSESGLSINISSTWIPPFQLDYLRLKKCQIGGPIPSWISTQFNLRRLDLSSNQLMGNLPSWLWSIDNIDLSDNHLQGSFTPTTGILRYLDLSMNELSGRVPDDIHVHLPNTEALILKGNQFEGQIPASVANLRNLIYLDMSNNILTGTVPATLGNLTHLRALNLENNHLEGEIPKELGSLSDLESLRIGKNSLQGILPSSIANLSSLQVLDVGENKLEGNIPQWIANFSSLQALVMRSNIFRGTLPPQIGLMSELQVLDLSSNLFSGVIPQSYLRLPAMKNSSAGLYVGISSERYMDSIDLIVKGQEWHYEYVLSTFVFFDLSDNRLNGPLPPEIENLKGMMYLNLSRNNISGPIPDSLGNLVHLESLDLSFNNFSGRIPAKLGNLNYLAHLNLSYNNLYGRIPEEGGQMLTFDESSYIGNPYLWGCPLQKKCSRRVARVSPPVGVKREDGFEFPWYWMCFGLSVGVGFSGVMGMLMLKLGWRTKCFQMMDRVIQAIDTVICKIPKHKGNTGDRHSDM